MVRGFARPAVLAAHIMNENDTVGWSFTGALTPAGLGVSCIVP
jgi:hypothetical protein